MPGDNGVSQADDCASFAPSLSVTWQSMLRKIKRRLKQGKYAGETFHEYDADRSLDPSSSTVHKSEVKPIEIVGQHHIYSVAFLGGGKHIVSGGEEGKIRCWRAEDGKEVGTPMDGSEVNNIAVSRDGKWIVSGKYSGELTVWDAESRKKVTEWQGHGRLVNAVDISPDGKSVATGSRDSTACVWSLSGQRLLGPLKHASTVVVSKFSPDGSFIATGTWLRSARVYDGQSGHLLVDIPVGIASLHNQALVWDNNGKNIFALSLDGRISYIDVSTGTTLFSWPIHIENIPGCIVLAGNGTFIAASDGPSVSFWDTTTRKRIGSIINHSHDVVSMAISANDDLVIGGGQAITQWNIHDVLPSSYHTDVSGVA